jgi:PTH2 family peptidyl-tRNA hydrolase
MPFGYYLKMTELAKLQQVIVIRKDLTMRMGKIVAQAGHAIEGAIVGNLSDKRVKTWQKTGKTKICVYVESEEELLNIYQTALSRGHIVNLVIDSGLTEFNGVPTKTCCAIGPATKEQLSDITGHLKLL